MQFRLAQPTDNVNLCPSQVPDRECCASVIYVTLQSTQRQAQPSCFSGGRKPGGEFMRVEGKYCIRIHQTRTIKKLQAWLNGRDPMVILESPLLQSRRLSSNFGEWWYGQQLEQLDLAKDSAVSPCFPGPSLANPDRPASREHSRETCRRF
jgi:hypothetical protein